MSNIWEARVRFVAFSIPKGESWLKHAAIPPYSLSSSSAPRRETESQKQKEERRLSNWLR